jgi:hypothetical protein
VDPKVPETALDLLNMKSLFEFLLKRFLPKVHQGKSVLDQPCRECPPIMPIYNVYFQFAALHIFKQIHHKMKRIKQIDSIPSNPKRAI